MASRNSPTRSKRKTARKKAKGQAAKIRAGSRGKTKKRASAQGAGKRRKNVEREEPEAAAGAAFENPAVEGNNGTDSTIEHVRSSMDEVIDDAKKAVGVA